MHVGYILFVAAVLALAVLVFVTKTKNKPIPTQPVSTPQPVSLGSWLVSIFEQRGAATPSFVDSSAVEPGDSESAEAKEDAAAGAALVAIHASLSGVTADSSIVVSNDKLGTYMFRAVITDDVVTGVTFDDRVLGANAPNVVDPVIVAADPNLVPATAPAPAVAS